MWDLRSKACVQTYKNHERGVRHAKFSPDGKWIASGCDKGEVKARVLTA